MIVAVCTTSSVARSFPDSTGAPESLRRELRLTNPDDFDYLNEGSTRFFSSTSSASKITKQQMSEEMKSAGFLSDIQLDDVNDFVKTDAGLILIIEGESG